MSRLVVATVVLLITVGGLFGAAAWNRGGDVQSIVLTERELRLAWNGSLDRSEIRLRLEWQPRPTAQDARLWLTDLKLREIGFTTGVPAGAPEAEMFYNRSLPRLAWVAFELNGPAWRLIERRMEMSRPPDLAEPTRAHGWPRERSRLVPIDAAVTPEPLRRRYAGAPVIVMPAVIRMRYFSSEKEGPSVWGEVEALVSPEISIPARLRGHLPPPTASDEEPRYEVDFRVGRLGAPWVEDIRPIGVH
jgi:hypothetical protein